MSVEPLAPELVMPPPGWTVEELDRQSIDGKTYRVLNGELFVMASQRRFQSQVVWNLIFVLRSAAPLGWAYDNDVPMQLPTGKKVVPDVIVLYPGTDLAADRALYMPDEIALAVEVVSPGSAQRDRVEKLASYAAAGVPNYWVIEDAGGGVPVVWTYALDARGKRYVETGVARDELQVDRPFPIKFDPRELFQ